MTRRGKLLSAIGGVVLAAGLGTSANGALMVRMVPSAGNPDPLAPAVGAVYKFDVHAIITGGSPSDGALQSLMGSFVSEGPLMGNLAPAGDKDGFRPPPQKVLLVALAPFHASGSEPGAKVDLDGDGDIDLGAPPGGAAGDDGADGFVVFRAPDAKYSQTYGGPGVETPDGLDFLIGRVSFTVTSTDGWTTLMFVPRKKKNMLLAAETALFLEDWVPVDLNDSTGGVFFDMANAPVIGIIPEPGTVSLLGLAGIGLLARRRR